MIQRKSVRPESRALSDGLAQEVLPERLPPLICSICVRDNSNIDTQTEIAIDFDVTLWTLSGEGGAWLLFINSQL
ncbi:MAG: hypothetical protein VYE13_12120 [Pseudomonadota bacterium]|nr:hypothetical protein [Pseudomonadota bacterium]